jgi:hypothetical protein
VTMQPSLCWTRTSPEGSYDKVMDSLYTQWHGFSNYRGQNQLTNILKNCLTCNYIFYFWVLNPVACNQDCGNTSFATISIVICSFFLIAAIATTTTEIVAKTVFLQSWCNYIPAVLLSQ